MEVAISLSGVVLNHLTLQGCNCLYQHSFSVRWTTPFPCGAGTCSMLTTKVGMHVGRQFYRCPAQGGSSCGFFKQCDDQQSRTGAPLQAPLQYKTGVTSTNQSISKSSSSCFKCGEENHWAKDCPNQSSDPYSDKGGRTLTPANSFDGCFECGNAGHWSRDCPAANCGAGAVGSHVKSSSTLGSWNSQDTDSRYL